MIDKFAERGLRSLAVAYQVSEHGLVDFLIPSLIRPLCIFFSPVVKVLLIISLMTSIGFISGSSRRKKRKSWRSLAIHGPLAFV